MRKTTLTTSTLLLAICMSQAIKNGYYSYYDISVSISCYITFFDEKYYYIELDDRVSDDVYHMEILSYGSFSQNKKKLLLIDAVSGYKMQLEVISEKEIKVNNGFPFLENKQLTYQRSESMSTEYYKSDYFEKAETEYSLQKDIKKYNLGDKCYILYDGVYSFDKYKLEIEKDSNYIFSYEGIVISKGTWNRKNNILSLDDRSLRQTLYVFIEKEGLNCKFLPGIYRDDLFILDQRQAFIKKLSEI